MLHPGPHPDAVKGRGEVQQGGAGRVVGTRGDISDPPMWSYALAVWGVRLPLSWWLGHVALGSSAGVYWAMIASQRVQCAMLLWVLLRVDWKRFALGSSRP